MQPDILDPDKLKYRRIIASHNVPLTYETSKCNEERVHHVRLEGSSKLLCTSFQCGVKNPTVTVILSVLKHKAWTPDHCSVE